MTLRKRSHWPENTCSVLIVNYRRFCLFSYRCTRDVPKALHASPTDETKTQQAIQKPHKCWTKLATPIPRHLSHLLESVLQMHVRSGGTHSLKTTSDTTYKFVYNGSNL